MQSPLGRSQSPPPRLRPSPTSMSSVGLGEQLAVFMRGVEDLGALTTLCAEELSGLRIDPARKSLVTPPRRDPVRGRTPPRPDDALPQLRDDAVTVGLMRRLADVAAGVAALGSRVDEVEAAAAKVQPTLARVCGMFEQQLEGSLDLHGRVEAIERQRTSECAEGPSTALATLESRVQAVEQRAGIVGTDGCADGALSALESRVQAIEQQRAARTDGCADGAIAALQSRVQAIERAAEASKSDPSAAALAALQARLEAVEQRAPSPGRSGAAPAALESRVDGVCRRLEDVVRRQSGLADEGAQMGRMGQQLEQGLGSLRRDVENGAEAVDKRIRLLELSSKATQDRVQRVEKSIPDVDTARESEQQSAVKAAVRTSEAVSRKLVSLEAGVKSTEESLSEQMAGLREYLHNTLSETVERLQKDARHERAHSPPPSPNPCPPTPSPAGAAPQQAPDGAPAQRRSPPADVVGTRTHRHSNPQSEDAGGVSDGELLRRVGELGTMSAAAARGLKMLQLPASASASAHDLSARVLRLEGRLESAAEEQTELLARVVDIDAKFRSDACRQRPRLSPPRRHECVDGLRRRVCALERLCLGKSEDDGEAAGGGGARGPQQQQQVHRTLVTPRAGLQDMWRRT
eukprot:TRINITY_DN21338_c0_g1_i1.p1 TRINITY_DN21338_c0_g1~~TRINITY_DN21338_c0_g1_i1.p1  ORF type:complete len:634 (+),score=169.54 TRINITY_DN21338_c0_g1_i1:47-1948(+)